MKAAIVVPSVRRRHIIDFLDSWKTEFTGQSIIVVEDNPERTFALDGRVQHYSWREIDDELGEYSWVIPRRSDCIRSYGFFKGWQQDVDFVVSVDDDCSPSENGFLAKHWEMLNAPASSHAWISTVVGQYPRGVPYFTTERGSTCVLNHGLWRGAPDYDALTELRMARCLRDADSVYPRGVPYGVEGGAAKWSLDHCCWHGVSGDDSATQPYGVGRGPDWRFIDQVIPRGAFFPMCGMNTAFRRELAPAMYFLLMGKDWPYDRFGDIWCGIFAKRICDHLGYSVRSGHPLVEHKRASDVSANLQKELPAYDINERLWRVVDSVVLTGRTFVDCYHELANQLTLPGEYWDRLRSAMHAWANLFSTETTGPAAWPGVSTDDAKI